MTSPAAAAHLAYVLLTRPPRVAERSWQASLREHARQSTLPFGSGHLALYDWGSGPTVLLVHGWGARGTHLGKLVPPLVAAGYRVVAFDAPGHGQSSGRSATLPQFASTNSLSFPSKNLMSSKQEGFPSAHRFKMRMVIAPSQSHSQEVGNSWIRGLWFGNQQES